MFAIYVLAALALPLLLAVVFLLRRRRPRLGKNEFENLDFLGRTEPNPEGPDSPHAPFLPEQPAGMHAGQQDAGFDSNQCDRSQLVDALVAQYQRELEQQNPTPPESSSSDFGVWYAECNRINDKVQQELRIKAAELVHHSTENLRALLNQSKR